MHLCKEDWDVVEDQLAKTGWHCCFLKRGKQISKPLSVIWRMNAGILPAHLETEGTARASTLIAVEAL